MPADWESAALAAGEIDLASLTWGWEDDVASLCEQQYCLVRWPDGTPDDFALRLTAARVSGTSGWLGDSENDNNLEAMVPSLDESALAGGEICGVGPVTITVPSPAGRGLG